MITPRIKVNADKLGALIPRYIAETRRGVRASLLTVSRTTTKELIKYTAPYDKADFTSWKAAKKIGESAVERDVRKVYWKVSKILFLLKEKGFYDEVGLIYRLIKRGELHDAMSVLEATGIRDRNTPIGYFDGGAEHRRSRSRRSGRVFRNRPAMIVIDSEKIEPYIQELQARVGFTRAGWITAALAGALGGMNKFPVWIKRWSGRAPGSGGLMEGKNGIKVRLKNAVSWTSTALPAGRIADALRDARMKLEKQMQIIIAHRRKRLK